MSISTYVQEILAQFAQALMLPAMIILVLLIALAIFSIGSVLVELVTERRHFQVALPEAITALEQAEYKDVNDTVLKTPLLWSQKAALLTVANNAGLPEDALYALAKAEVNRVATRYRKIIGRTDLITKIAPMMGLMCTLIPLGPGIVAMGQGNVATLSSSLGVAFDGTVAGLVSAVVSMTVSHVRKVWYGRYQSALEAMMTTLLEKIEHERAAGAELPSGFGAKDLEPLRLRAKELAAAGESVGAAKPEAPAGAATNPADAKAGE
jgi:biopolymer transport protein ExbB/TolQ